MNIRSLTRGDGVVIGAAVLLLIASFLSFAAPDCPSGVSDCASVNGWTSNLAPASPAPIFLLGIIAAALVVAGRFQPAGRNLFGLSLVQWGAGVALADALSALYVVAFSHPDHIDKGAGQWLGALGAILVLVGVALPERVPALGAPLVSNTPKPTPYGGPGAPQPGYGYPGAGQPQPGAYGYQQPGQPQPGQPQPGQQQPFAAQPTAAAQPAVGGPAAAPAGDFSPFWFAVPVARPLYAEDGSPTPVAELAPGTWYLAVEQRGQALVAQTQDGRRGVLQDTTGIQRG